jgi:hypothetical protein
MRANFIAVVWCLCAALAMAPRYAQAEAWVLNEGKAELLTTYILAPDESTLVSGSSYLGGENVHYNIYGKQNHHLKKMSYELGLKGNVSLMVQLSRQSFKGYYATQISYSEIVDDEPKELSQFTYINTTFSAAQMGVNYQLMKGDVSAAALKAAVEVGERRFGQAIAAQVMFSYGEAFSLPFGVQYGNFIEFSAGGKRIQKTVGNETLALFSANVGVRPCGNSVLMLLGLYSMWGEYIAPQPSWVNKLILSQNAKVIKQHLEMKRRINHQHQLGLQLAYTVPNMGTIYLQTFSDLKYPLTDNSRRNWGITWQLNF